MKITRVRVYAPPNANPLFNQSDMVVTVETDAGITGIGEGGSKDMLEQCAGRLIGKDPQYIERFGRTCRAPFSIRPAARRCTPWARSTWRCGTSKARCWTCPCTLLGGMVRNYCECYNTAGIVPGIRPGMSLKERAQATIAAGYRAFRMGAAEAPANGTYNTHQNGSTGSTTSACRRARASARTATGASISTSASISPTPSAAAI